MKNKKVIYVGILIFFIFILFLYYKNFKTGKNISKSISDFKEYILNISSYEATISVEITSNKNINKYKIKQWYVSPNLFKQEILAPENIQGLTTYYNDGKIKIENTRLNISKIYEDYNYITNNILSLNGFIEESKDKEIKEIEQDNKIILQIETDKKYAKYRELTINKTTGLPIEMKIMNENKKNLVYILYNEISINNITIEDVI